MPRDNGRWRRAIDWRGSQPLTRAHDAPRAWWSTGYAFDANDRLLVGDEIGHELSLCSDRAQLERAVAAFNGCFAAVVMTADHAALVNDRWGSIPLFYTDRGDGVVASDEPWAVVAALPRAPQLDDVAVVDMVRLGYVCGSRTLVDGVSSVRAAHIADVVEGQLRERRYWRYGYASDAPPPLRELDPALDEVVQRFDAVASRIDRLRERHDTDVRLMITGGLDTRILAAVLANTKSVTEAVSYGGPTDGDVVAAERIARAAGMPFANVPAPPDTFDEASIERGIVSSGLTARFTCGAGARLVDDAPSRLTILGHTGFLSSDLGWMNWTARNRRQSQQLLYLRHFWFPDPAGFARAILPAVDHDRRPQSLEETLSDWRTDLDPVGEIHRWNSENRQRRLVLSEQRTYGQQGPWMLPLNDYDVCDLFLEIPHSLRIAQLLYARVGLDRLFTGELAELGTVERVGHALKPDPRKYARFRLARALGRATNGHTTSVVKYTRSAVTRVRPDRVQRSGPNPLRHWFQSDQRVHELLRERARECDAGGIDGIALAAALRDPRATEKLFQVLLPGAVTVQAVDDHAAQVWHAARRGAQPSEPAVADEATGA